jgi:hypothetical protein
MFWNMTNRRLGGAAVPLFPRTYAARPDLETGTRLLAMATEAGLLFFLSGPPPEGRVAAPPVGLPDALRPGPTPGGQT